MAKRFIIKDETTNKFYHLAVSKGSYIIRDYRDPKEKPVKIETGKEGELDEKVWNKYKEQPVAPYHSIDDTEFWYNVLSQGTIEDVKEKNLNGISEQKDETTVKTKLSFVFTVILVFVSKIIDVNFLNIESLSINFNIQSIEIVTKITELLLIVALIVLIVQLSKLKKLSTEFLAAYMDKRSSLDNNK
ncbi:MAG: hypothetical protein LBG80_15760 [Bacteroidales bacterium]|jgi:hypothetical protein|nr:hypothetical protein [Bacteroidales bacterium]